MTSTGGTAAVFTGQGAQAVGMGRDLYERFPSVRRLFDAAGEIVGYDIKKYCFDGPVEKLEQTDIQQPAILLVSAAYWQAMCETAGGALEVSAAAGLSLGEYTALHAAGALSFEDALRLVHVRGSLMWESGRTQPGGMVCVMNLDEAKVRELCQRAAGGEVLTLANLNCPGQIVLSGTKSAVRRALDLCGEYGTRGVELPVSGAFHSPLMAEAAGRLREELDRATFGTTRFPVYSNVTAEPHGGPETMRELLFRQMTSPVLWERTVRNLASRGVSEFLEPGPGRVLTGLMRRIDRNIRCRNVSTAEDVAKLSPQVQASLEGSQS